MILRACFKIVAADPARRERLKYYRKYGVLGREVSLVRLAGSAASGKEFSKHALSKLVRRFCAIFFFMGMWPAVHLLAFTGGDFAITSNPVGRSRTNIFETPVNQVLTPAGVQLELPNMRPQALALSPDA